MEPRHGRQQGNNADYRWNRFDSTDYFQHNYSALRHDDGQILEAIRDFFCKADRATPAPKDAPVDRPARGLDLGSGTNLYPALAMLPFCAELTLWEYSTGNVEWLSREIRSYSASWDLFWDRLAPAPQYQRIANPRAALAERARVHQGSVFDLPAGRWDIGTMFFVAESMTSSRAEFEAATHRFIRALQPGAPFAAAFMENSRGYRVGDSWYPAVAVTQEIVRNCLEEDSGNLDVQRVDPGNEPLRDGYSGMILVLGTAGAG